MTWPPRERRPYRLLVLLREQVWFILILLLLSGNVGLVYWRFLAPTRTPAAPRSSPAAPAPVASVAPTAKVPSPLNGILVESDEAARRPVAVAVDNFPSARPQSGLGSASLVWETLVEGGVTRFLAIWQASRDITIGPVRSARDYFVPWVKEVDAVFAHSGGSPAGLAALKADRQIDNADEFRNGRAYFRTTGAAPHNLYTTTAQLSTLVRDSGWRTTSNITPWPVDEAPTTDGQAAARMTVNFSTVPAYRVQWRYDETAHRYFRSQGGAVATDRETEQQITATNVIIMFAPVTPAPPPAPPEAVEVATVGNGEAWFLRDGRIIKGRWVKRTASDRTQWLKTDNRTPYTIARGPVWVEVVPKNQKQALRYE